MLATELPIANLNLFLIHQIEELLVCKMVRPIYFNRTIFLETVNPQGVGGMKAGACKLCKEPKDLCDSHYLPKGVYRSGRAEELKNPNPVVIENGQWKQLADQLRGYAKARLLVGGFDLILQSTQDPSNSQG